MILGSLVHTPPVMWLSKRRRNWGLWYMEGVSLTPEGNCNFTTIRQHEEVKVFGAKKQIWRGILKKTMTDGKFQHQQPNLAFIQTAKDKQLFGLLSHRAITPLLCGVSALSLTDNLQTAVWPQFYQRKSVGNKFGQFKDKTAHSNVVLVSGRASQHRSAEPTHDCMVRRAATNHYVIIE